MHLFLENQGILIRYNEKFIISHAGNVKTRADPQNDTKEAT